MTTNIPRAFTDRANDSPRLPVNVDAPSHPATGTTDLNRRNVLMRTATAFASTALVAAPSFAAGAPLAEENDAVIAAERAVEIVRVLRTYRVRDGWQIDNEAAERALAWFNGRVTGRVSDDEPMTDEGMAAMRFLGDHGQSLDWVFMGDIKGVICALAAHSKQAARSVAVADPIFAALDAFGRAEAEFYANLPEWRGNIPDKVGDRWSRSIDVVICTLPTTPAGLIALTSFARNMVERAKRDATFTERQRVSVMATIDDAARGMSGLDPWSPPVVTANDAELIELGRRWKMLKAQCDLAEELSEPNGEAFAAALDVIREQATADGTIGNVPNSVFIEASERVNAAHPLPSPTVEEVFAAKEPVERHIMALRATTTAGLAVKARVAKFYRPNLWKKSDDDADWGDRLLRSLVDAAIEHDAVLS